MTATISTPGAAAHRRLDDLPEEVCRAGLLQPLTAENLLSGQDALSARFS